VAAARRTLACSRFEFVSGDRRIGCNIPYNATLRILCRLPQVDCGKTGLRWRLRAFGRSYAGYRFTANAWVPRCLLLFLSNAGEIGMASAKTRTGWQVLKGDSGPSSLWCGATLRTGNGMARRAFLQTTGENYYPANMTLTRCVAGLATPDHSGWGFTATCGRIRLRRRHRCAGAVLSAFGISASWLGACGPHARSSWRSCGTRCQAAFPRTWLNSYPADDSWTLGMVRDSTVPLPIAFFCYREQRLLSGWYCRQVVFIAIPS
jgi:hypothetical protein